MKIILPLAALGIVAVSAMALSSSPAPDEVQPRAPLPGLVTAPGQPFVTKFSSINTKIWSVSDGWSNGPYMVNDWRKSQIRLGKTLELLLERRAGGAQAYSSGEVQSRLTYGHGYYEVTMQAARGSGIVAGFFTYTGPPFGRPWNEIDVEILGKNTREASLTYFYEGKSRSHIAKLDFDAAETLHHYAFDWQPGHLRWYVDGELVHEANGAELPLPNEQQKIMMHLWGTQRSKEWAGSFDPSAIPANMHIGCVAYSSLRSGVDKCSIPLVP